MDAAELAALYERYGHLVHRRCMALLGNRSDADDALQETFCRVYRYGGPSHEQATLGWLYSIAANCCFDARRRKQPASADAPLEEGDALAQTGSTNPDHRAVVGAILNRVEPRVRDIGVLHYLGGYTQDEIAAKTGFSRRTVGKKLHEFETTFMAWWAKATGGTP